MGLLGITRLSFHLYGLEAISGIKNKSPKTIEKDTLISLIAQEIPMVWGTTDEEILYEITYLVIQMTKLYISYKLDKHLYFPSKDGKGDGERKYNLEENFPEVN